MSKDSEPTPTAQDSGQPWTRNGIIFLVIAVALGGLFLVLDLKGERPDFYQPARGSITEAALMLSETYSDEKELESRYQSVHRELDHAISLLDKAENLDPAHRREIETLRTRLKALEDPNRLGAGDPDSLKHSYHELIKQLNTLAGSLEHSKP